jgi:hypothetical protein
MSNAECRTRSAFGILAFASHPAIAHVLPIQVTTGARMPKARIIRLIAAGAAVAAVTVLALVFRASSGPGPASAPRRARADVRPDWISSTAFTRVKLHGLEQLPSSINDGGRDPFSFRPRPAVLRTPSAAVPPHPVLSARPESSPVPAPVAAPFRFMGVLERGAVERWAVFADCAGYTRAAKEGESVLGAWRVMRIAVESVAIESLDGRPLIMAQGGCAPR